MVHYNMSIMTTNDVGMTVMSTHRDNTTTSNNTNLQSTAATSAMIAEDNPSTFFIAIFCIFLFIIELIAIIGNIWIILTFLRSRHFKGVILLYFVINICVIQLCDGIFVVLVSFLVAVNRSWNFSTEFCQINAFLVELFSVADVVALVALVTDQFISMQNSTFYIKCFTLPTIIFMISYVWIHSLIFSVPILSSSVPVEYSDERFGCAVANNVSTSYIVSTGVFSYALPLTIIICLYAVVIRKHAFGLNQSAGPDTNYQNEIQQFGGYRDKKYVKSIGIIILLWCVLRGPYHLVDYINLLSTNDSHSSLLTLMKLSYPAVVPVCITLLWPDLRRQMKQVILCRNNDMISSVHTRQQEGILDFNIRKQNSVHTKSVDPGTVYQVPVLFATSNGLQLTVVGRNGNQADGFKRISSGIKLNKSTAMPNFGVVNISENELDNYSTDLSGDDDTLNASWSSHVDTQRSVVTRTDVGLNQSPDIKMVIQ